MSPEPDRAQKASTRLMGKWWEIRPVRVILPWICFNWAMELQDSMMRRTGFVISSLVFEFHLSLAAEEEEKGMQWR